MPLINKIKEKFNSVFVRYTSPIFLTNRTANLDSSYGPYELPTGVTVPTIDILDADTKATLYPGKTFGIIINGQVVEYWAQLKDSVVQATGYKFDEAVEKPENYELIIKQCVDLDDVEITRIPARDIDRLFDDDLNDPTIDPDYENETTGGTEEQGPTGGTEE